MGYRPHKSGNSGDYPAPTLATNGVTAGSYGTQTNTLSVTVDAKGRVSGISTNSPITPASIGAATTAQGALADSAVQAASTNTLSNKTISGSSNTLTNIPAANLTGTVPTNSLPNITLNMSGVLHASPVTLTNGTGTVSLASQAANTHLSGPASGTNAAPTFRALVAADLPSATTNSIGAAQLATDTEIQTGTDTAKSVRVSGLAAWWTYVKGLAQTFGNNLSVNGNLNAGDAAGDNHTIRGNMRGQDQAADYADSYMTRSLVDARSLWLRSNWTWATVPTVTTAPSTSGTGAVVTTTTIGGPSVAGYARASIGEANFLSNGGDYSGQIKMGTPFFIGWKVIFQGYASGITYRMILGTTPSYTSGEPGFDSFGFRITGSTAQAFVRNGTTPVYLTGITLTKTNALLFSIYNNGSVLEFYINGTSLGTLAVPTAIGGALGGTPMIYGVVENDGSVGSTRYMSLPCTITGAPSQFTP